MMMKRLYQIATRDYPLREDAALRQMSVEEMRGTYSLHVAKRLELPGCLMFLVSSVRLGKSISRRSLVRKLVSANARSDATKEVMEQFMRAAKRVVFDGHHTLTFMFMSKKAANDWRARRSS
ncbi:unnamed protein product [Peronospora effusa]|nr:unnamed protein product [Peronospora effusa]